MWFVPNGFIGENGNRSQIRSLDVEVTYGSDRDRAGALVKAAADRVWHERRAGASREPALSGIEGPGDSGVSIRIAKCAGAQQ